MPRSARLTFLSLSLALVLFPLGIVRPGWPPTLKADEPAYYGMALSLAHDFDVRCDLSDVRRLTDGYPYLPINNLILMSDDGWETVYYGKPYIFSLIAAPAVRFFGEHGMVAVNMLLLMAMIWMGSVYLGRFNSWQLAMLFSVGFFVLSSAFAYVFWLQPEILNMFSIAACLFLAFHQPEGGPRAADERRRLLRILGSGAVLALAVYNKPVLAALGLPALWVVYRKRGGWKAVSAWLAAATLAMGLLAGLGYALSGHPTAYLGVARGGVRLEDPDETDDYLARLRDFVAKRADENANSWQWIFHVPEVQSAEFFENLGYFLWGRHTGLFLYMPFAGLALLLFLINSPRSGSRWIVIGSSALVALFFLLFIEFNWHGGGGFVGNRYFVNVYPAFLFLLTRIRPAWSVAAGYAVGGLFLGPIVFSPFGAPVPSPTLQAHVRNYPFRSHPLELTIKKNVPGYDGTNLGGVRLLSRSDHVRTSKKRPGMFWVQGAVEIEVLMLTRRPLDSLMFEVRTIAPDNEVRIETAGEERIVPFESAHNARSRRTTVEIDPGEPERMTYDAGQPIYVYEMRVEPRTGRVPRGSDGEYIDPPFYLGTVITYLGQRHQLEEQAHYQVTWEAVEAPDSVAARSEMQVTTTLRNDGETAWSSQGAIPVNLGYHWLDAAGETLRYEGTRTAFREQVEPGATTEVTMTVLAPDEPGLYTLELDLVRERIAWFSRRGAATERVQVEVTEAVAAPPEAAGATDPQ
jgi:hypothetical protein